MMQSDLFSELPVATKPLVVIPKPRDELDEAIDDLAACSIEWIIRRVISQKAAALLRTFRTKTEFDKKEIKAFGPEFVELLNRQCIRYESKGSPAVLRINSKRIFALADETNRRLTAWREIEDGKIAA
jgi:hypothetical protein